MQLLAPLTVVDLYGTPTLLMHGDSLCTLDIGYQKFRAWWDQKWWQKLILSLPLWYRQHLARKARRVSAMDKKGKSSEIMDVTPDEVPKVMTQHQVQHLIHGHTHRPMVHQLELADGSAAQRYVFQATGTVKVLIWMCQRTAGNCTLTPFPGCQLNSALNCVWIYLISLAFQPFNSTSLCKSPLCVGFR